MFSVGQVNQVDSHITPFYQVASTLLSDLAKRRFINEQIRAQRQQNALAATLGEPIKQAQLALLRAKIAHPLFDHARYKVAATPSGYARIDLATNTAMPILDPQHRPMLPLSLYGQAGDNNVVWVTNHEGDRVPIVFNGQASAPPLGEATGPALGSAVPRAPLSPLALLSQRQRQQLNTTLAPNRWQGILGRGMNRYGGVAGQGRLAAPLALLSQRQRQLGLPSQWLRVPGSMSSRYSNAGSVLYDTRNREELTVPTLSDVTKLEQAIRGSMIMSPLLQRYLQDSAPYMGFENSPRAAYDYVLNAFDRAPKAYVHYLDAIENDPLRLADAMLSSLTLNKTTQNRKAVQEHLRPKFFEGRLSNWRNFIKWAAQEAYTEKVSEMLLKGYKTGSRKAYIFKVGPGQVYRLGPNISKSDIMSRLVNTIALKFVSGVYDIPLFPNQKAAIAWYIKASAKQRENYKRFKHDLEIVKND